MKGQKMTEKFNLKWNEFQSNVSKSFSLLRKESYLQDITLVSDDLETISAHKLVLSASSEYFRRILHKTDSKVNSLLCLDGVSSTDLKNVLDYVYDGEVKIDEDKIDRFLNVAQKLKLEGLQQKESPYYKPDEEAKTNFTEMPSTFEEVHTDEDFDDKSKVIDKQFHDAKTGSESFGSVSIIGNNGELISEHKHKKRLYENVIAYPDWSASCKICGKMFSAQKKPGDATYSARRHVEVHLEGVTYTCFICHKDFRSKNAYQSHLSRSHKNC